MQPKCDKNAAAQHKASQVLGAEGFHREALFLGLERERGRKLPYRTFYDWCQVLGVDPGGAMYSAEETLLLLTLCWAYGKRYRNLDYATVKQLQETYIQCKLVKSSET